jgi:hypothetical protein
MDGNLERRQLNVCNLILVIFLGKRSKNTLVHLKLQVSKDGMVERKQPNMQSNNPSRLSRGSAQRILILLLFYRIIQASIEEGTWRGRIWSSSPESVQNTNANTSNNSLQTHSDVD